jgi:hypothetical protein
MEEFCIHAVMDDPKPGLYNVHTHGLVDHGFMDLMTISDNPEVAAYMLSSAAHAMLRGEYFDPFALHWIDEEDGTSILNFEMGSIRENYEEENLYLNLNWYNPDFEFPKLKGYGRARRD